MKTYHDDEPIPLLVNKLYSDQTQLQYAYFDLPFVCPATGDIHGSSTFASGKSISLNLGEVLRGDRMKTSDFEISMNHDIECQYLCDRQVDVKDVKWAQQLIEDGYVTEWILDNLPSATSFVTVDRSKKYYAAGFKVGYKDFLPGSSEPVYYLNNHHTMVIRWRKAPGKDGDRGHKVVVGFEVYTKSVGSQQRNETGCPREVSGDVEPFTLQLPRNETDTADQYTDSSYIPPYDDSAASGSITIPYTYSVYFREENEVQWNNRWDLYFSDQAESSWTHWLAILNSFIISGVLGAICIVIWGRTMGGDVAGRGDGALESAKLTFRKRRSGEKKVGLLEKIDEQGEEVSSEDEMSGDVSGWKLLHGDVFRSPALGGLLAPIVGSGMQLLFMVAGLLILSCLGVLNPSFRGGFVSVGVGLFIFAGAFSGYFSSRVYKTFGGKDWRKNNIVASQLIFYGGFS